MTILDVLNQPWALTPEKLDAMCDVYERHVSGANLDDAAIKAAIGDGMSSSGSDVGYTVNSGVAIIPVEGVLAKKMNLFTAISGGMSTQMLVSAVNNALADMSVHSIMLSIDSPGGEVDGTQQIADAIAKATKPTAAWIDGQGCSAAMWIAAQCDSIYAASDTTMVGSIAVLMTHTDRSKANEARGVKPTHITTGKYKRILSSDAPLSQDGLNYAQSQLDYLHTLFINAVADGRGVDPDVVDTQMADGKTFFAQQAVEIGLIDGISSEDAVISMLVSAYQDKISNPGAATTGQNRKPGAIAMSVFKTFATEAEYNAEINAAVERGKASATVTAAAVEAARNEGIVAGATSERERIVAIESLPLASSHPDLIKKLKGDGKTSAIEAASEILKAEGALQTQHSAARKSELPEPAAASHPDAAKEAAAAAAAAGTGAAKQINPYELAGKIRALQAKAKAEGRTLSAAQAEAEINAAAS